MSRHTTHQHQSELSSSPMLMGGDFCQASEPVLPYLNTLVPRSNFSGKQILSQAFPNWSRTTLLSVPDHPSIAGSHDYTVSSLIHNLSGPVLRQGRHQEVKDVNFWYAKWDSVQTWKKSNELLELGELSSPIKPNVGSKLLEAMKGLYEREMSCSADIGEAIIRAENPSWFKPTLVGSETLRRRLDNPYTKFNSVKDAAVATGVSAGNAAQENLFPKVAVAQVSTVSLLTNPELGTPYDLYSEWFEGKTSFAAVPTDHRRRAMYGINFDIYQRPRIPPPLPVLESQFSSWGSSEDEDEEDDSSEFDSLVEHQALSDKGLESKTADGTQKLNTDVVSLPSPLRRVPAHDDLSSSFNAHLKQSSVEHAASAKAPLAEQTHVLVAGEVYIDVEGWVQKIIPGYEEICPQTQRYSQSETELMGRMGELVAGRRHARAQRRARVARTRTQRRGWLRWLFNR